MRRSSSPAHRSSAAVSSAPCPSTGAAEAGDDPRKNDEMFAAAIEELRAGGIILIFPEGTRRSRSRSCCRCGTGAARLVLGAERAMGDTGRRNAPARRHGLPRPGNVSVRVGPGHDRRSGPSPPISSTAHRDQPRRSGAARITARLTGRHRRPGSSRPRTSTRSSCSPCSSAHGGRRRRAGASPRPRTRSSRWRGSNRSCARDGICRSRATPRRRGAAPRIELLPQPLPDEVGITSAQLGQPYTSGLVISVRPHQRAVACARTPAGVLGIVSHAAPYWLTGRIVGGSGEPPRRKRRTRWPSAS